MTHVKYIFLIRRFGPIKTKMISIILTEQILWISCVTKKKKYLQNHFQRCIQKPFSYRVKAVTEFISLQYFHFKASSILQDIYFARFRLNFCTLKGELHRNKWMIKPLLIAPCKWISIRLNIKRSVAVYFFLSQKRLICSAID